MSSMVRMSEATALGLHAIVHLAETNERATTQEIARRLNASVAHLSKVLQRLASSGIVSGLRGPHGGFQLAVGAETLRLMDIYESLEGPFTANGCLFAKPVCDRVSCIMGGLVERLNSEIREYLTQTTVACLVRTAGGPTCAACLADPVQAT